VAAAFCAFCGKPVPPGAAFCPSCGATVARTPAAAPMPTYGAPPPAGPPMAGGWSPPPTYAGAPYPGTPYPAPPPGPSPQERQKDGEALRAIEIAAIIALVGFAFSAATLVLTPIENVITTTTSSPSTNSTVHFSLNTTFFYVLIAAGGLFTLLEYAWYRSGFHTLAAYDTRFRTPAALVIVAIVGYILVILGAVIFVNDLGQLVNSCPGGSTSNLTAPSCAIPSGFWAALALVLVGAIVALVGFIGLLIGIWRLGTRFSDGLFKAGAILLIFPFLQIIGAILVLVAAHGCRAKVLGPGPTAPGSF